MKIGVLTFHSQLNYGGVLQTWASQWVLRDLGYDVVVIDRWFDARNRELLGPLAGMSLREFASWVLHACAGCGQVAQLIRHLRTICFVRKQLRLTPYHFVEWKELGKRSLGLDGIVVGSDQVWNANGAPAPFLLEGCPRDMLAIAYAASFGMQGIPAAWASRFQAGLRRFNAISVRESEGVFLANSLDVQAEHVLDPTQLVPDEVWREMAFVGRMPTHSRKRKLLVCYFLAQDRKEAWPMLECFAAQYGCDVVVLGNGAFPESLSLKKLIRQARFRISRYFGSVRACISAGPREFVRFFSQADWVISDSFHALMFASIFDKNVRILRPTLPQRMQMFARIEEFVARYISGSVIMPNLSDALRSLSEPIAYNHSALIEARQHSLDWLRTHLQVPLEQSR